MWRRLLALSLLQQWKCLRLVFGGAGIATPLSPKPERWKALLQSLGEELDSLDFLSEEEEQEFGDEVVFDQFERESMDDWIERNARNPAPSIWQRRTLASELTEEELEEDARLQRGESHEAEGTAFSAKASYAEEEAVAAEDGDAEEEEEKEDFLEAEEEAAAVAAEEAAIAYHSEGEDADATEGAGDVTSDAEAAAASDAGEPSGLPEAAAEAGFGTDFFEELPEEVLEHQEVLQAESFCYEDDLQKPAENIENGMLEEEEDSSVDQTAATDSGADAIDSFLEDDEAALNAAAAAGAALRQHRAAAARFAAGTGAAKGARRPVGIVTRAALLHFSARMLRRSCKDAAEYFTLARSSAAVMVVLWSGLDVAAGLRLRLPSWQRRRRRGGSPLAAGAVAAELAALAAERRDLRRLRWARFWSVAFLVLGYCLNVALRDPSPLYVGAGLGLLSYTSEPAVARALLGRPTEPLKAGDAAAVPAAGASGEDDDGAAGGSALAGEESAAAERRKEKANATAGVRKRRRRKRAASRARLN